MRIISKKYIKELHCYEYKFLGIKLRIRNENTHLRSEIDSLREIINLYCDITKAPVANGEKRRVQIECLKIAEKIKDIFDENNLEYWLDFGSLLGAIRHKGFVPWDDDIDFSATRETIEKVLPLLKLNFENSNYSVNLKAENRCFFQIRIASKTDKKVGVDIFPVDYYNKVFFDKKDVNIFNKKFQKARKQIKRKFGHRKLNGQEIETARQLIKKLTKNLLNREEQVSHSALFYGLDYPCITKIPLFAHETIFPLKKIDFEGVSFSCPNNVEKHLENLYGNYMKFPKSVEL